MNKCERCNTEFKEINGRGCFVEYKLYNGKLNDLIIIRGNYDGTNRSYMQIVLRSRLKQKILKHKVPYSLEFFDGYCETLTNMGYSIIEMRSENYKYLECKCDLSVVGEPL